MSTEEDFATFMNTIPVADKNDVRQVLMEKKWLTEKGRVADTAPSPAKFPYTLRSQAQSAEKVFKELEEMMNASINAAVAQLGYDYAMVRSSLEAVTALEVMSAKVLMMGCMMATLLKRDIWGAKFGPAANMVKLGPSMFADWNHSAACMGGDILFSEYSKLNADFRVPTGLVGILYAKYTTKVPGGPEKGSFSADRISKEDVRKIVSARVSSYEYAKSDTIVKWLETYANTYAAPKAAIGPNVVLNTWQSRSKEASSGKRQ